MTPNVTIVSFTHFSPLKTLKEFRIHLFCPRNCDLNSTPGANFKLTILALPSSSVGKLCLMANFTDIFNLRHSFRLSSLPFNSMLIAFHFFLKRSATKTCEGINLFNFQPSMQNTTED